jgi:hypothetical protein
MNAPEVLEIVEIRRLPEDYPREAELSIGGGGPSPS